VFVCLTSSSQMRSSAERLAVKPSHWTSEEKDTFMRLFTQRGRDWKGISAVLGSKTPNQVSQTISLVLSHSHSHSLSISFPFLQFGLISFPLQFMTRTHIKLCHVNAQVRNFFQNYKVKLNLTSVLPPPRSAKKDRVPKRRKPEDGGTTSGTTTRNPDEVSRKRGRKSGGKEDHEHDVNMTDSNQQVGGFLLLFTTRC
jgi:hypothetical protein